MKVFLFLVFVAALAVGYVHLTGGLSFEAPVLSLKEKLAAVGITIKKGYIIPAAPTKPTSSGSLEEEVVEAAKLLKPHIAVPAYFLVAIAEQETAFGLNFGETGRALRRARSIEEQVILATLAGTKGLNNPNLLEVSSAGAFGLVQARPTYYLTHCGMRVDFGTTPVVLLHGTERYRSMTRAERAAGVKEIQRKMGLAPEEVDGLVGLKTLDAIEGAVGRRGFDKVGKYLLVKKLYGDQVKVVTSKKRDKVFQRICFAEGKDPAKTKYFMPDLWKPMHALAYASVHVEDDLRIARAKRSFRRFTEAVDMAIAAYYCGIKSAINHNRDGLWYKNQVKAKAKKFKKSFT